MLLLGINRQTHTHMSEAVSRQVLTLKKPLVTHGASVRFSHLNDQSIMCYFL